MVRQFKGQSQNVLVKCSDIMSDHNGRTFFKFGRTMSDDRLLFSALELEQGKVTGQGIPQGWLAATGSYMHFVQETL